MPKKVEKPKYIKKVVPAPPIIDQNQRYEIPEANSALRQSNSKTFEDIAAGRLRVIRDGGRVYIPGAEIIRRSTLGAWLKSPAEQD